MLLLTEGLLSMESAALEQSCVSWKNAKYAMQYLFYFLFYSIYIFIIVVIIPYMLDILKSSLLKNSLSPPLSLS